MQTRRDHLQAYRFATGRLASALLTGDIRTGAGPLHRARLGSVFGIVLAALLIGGFAVYGLLKPQPGSWRTAGPFVAEKESGTRYLYTGGVLHPVLNYASALLALGKPTQPHQVPRSDLNGVPRGTVLGIAGAPDAIPSAEDLLTGAWSECLHPRRPGDLVIDFQPAGHAATVVPAGVHVLVVDPHGTHYVVLRDTKYRVPGRAALVALGLDADDPVTAPAAWLADLPTGPDLTQATVPGSGSPGPRVAGRALHTGDLLRTSVAGSVHFYVLRSDGVAPVTATEAALLSVSHGQPREVTPDAVAALPESADRSLLTRLPDVVRTRDAGTGTGALCLRQRMRGSTLNSVLVTESGSAAADGSSILLPAGSGVLATPPATGDSTPAQLYLITDQGRRYPLADDRAATALGYSATAARTLPRVLLESIPAGPTLGSTGVTGGRQ
ncbi:MAG: type VII secretion protein EccB [Streptomyces sp.]|uniref:type VII secretion protein EccB n=1 Tax=Streptomyces sp. TaxID=1931 RepID=UPI0025F91EC3|nr:type VII secretion protein EccB [Streptomyces sp.]MBW8792680.1 type VII secretion protein EccB [Streptomyces sp.]